MTAPANIGSGAELSDCARYRYRLWRSWSPLGRRVVFVMLNPSTADATQNDATIRKCIGFANRLDAGRIDVVNLFAYRATKPHALLEAEEPIGPSNDQHILDVAGRQSEERTERDIVICAWGCPSSARLQRIVRERSRQVRDLLLDRDLQCLGRASDGSPRHPLLLSYSSKLEPWRLG